MTIYQTAHAAIAASRQQRGAMVSCEATELNLEALRRAASDWRETDGGSLILFETWERGDEWSVSCRVSPPLDGECAVLCVQYPTPEAVEQRRLEVSRLVSRDASVMSAYFHPVPGGWRLQVTRRGDAR
jgi:hypothetical protein